MSDIEEAAKLGTTVVEATTKMGGFLSNILNEPITEAVGIFGDKLKFMRWKRKLRIVDEVNRILDERKVESIRPIPPKLAIPMLEQASLEENDELQDIWCKLISNTLDPNFKLEIRYAFIDIIKNLTTLDAKILRYVYNSTKEKGILFLNLNSEKYRYSIVYSMPLHFAEIEDSQKDADYEKENYSPPQTHYEKGNSSPFPISFEEIQENTKSSTTETIISLNNLKRVQCLWDYYSRETNIMIYDSTNKSPFPEVFKQSNSYVITPLGESFVLACMK